MTDPTPKPLSPAAQAVLDSMYRSYDHKPTRRLIAASILRAVADQVIEEVSPVEAILAIAAELEGCHG